VIRNDRDLGFAASCNEGLASAKGEILVLLRDDVIVTPNWLVGLAQHLDDPEVGLVLPATNRSKGAAQVAASYTRYGEMVRFAHRRRKELAGEPPRDIEDADMFCVALRRGVFEVIGPLDDRVEIGALQDDYAGRVRDAGHRVVCAVEVFAHRFDEASLDSLDERRETPYEPSQPSEARGNAEKTA
jgi:GT2 family glycosyltransferase